jgi:hypothetical protein
MTELTNKIDFLAKAFEIEAAMLERGAIASEQSESVCPVKHSFGKGCYIREWNSPADMLVVSKVHKVEHPYFVLKGKISVMTDTGIEVIEAPHYGITPAGTKRVLYTHSETQWITVHVTDERDIDKIEKAIIADDPVNQLDLGQAYLAVNSEASK